MTIQKKIRSKLITEKTAWLATRKNAYSFHVDPAATKAEIKAEIEAEYSVVVEKVRTRMEQPISKRFRQHAYMTSFKKVAIVKLSAGNTLPIFE